MSRSHEELEVFQMAHALVRRVYAASAGFPVAERFALQSQVRRAATSVPTNIVEGAGRYSRADFIHFLTIAAGSAAEAQYLCRLSAELGFMQPELSTQLFHDYDRVRRALSGLIRHLKSTAAAPSHPRPPSPPSHPFFSP
jgi:four helix bundle protein